jgi:hypothetical protein
MKENNTKTDITNWLDNAGRYPVLSPDRVCMIAREIQSLPEESHRRRKLVNTLARHNLRLVVSFVKSFLAAAPVNKWGCTETVDYLQVGAIGLIRAAEMYDPTKGYTFATYANYWIRSKVSRYNIKNRSLVHVSESMSRKIIFYSRNGYLKSKKNGERYDDNVIVPVLREANAALSYSSLNVPDDKGNEMINKIPDRSSKPGSDLLYEDIHQALDNAGITPLGKEVLVSLFVHEETCPQIAIRLSMPVARIRKEKETALTLARCSKELAGLV